MCLASHNAGFAGRMLPAMEFANGWEVFAAFIVVMLVAITHGVYSRSGNGIGFHPYRRWGSDAPGAYRPSQISGRDGIVNTTSRGTR